MFTENARSEFVHYDEELTRANRPEIWYDKQKAVLRAAVIVQRSKVILKDFVLKGSLCFSTDANTMQTMDDGYLVCENGRIAGVSPRFRRSMPRCRCWTIPASSSSPA